MYIKFKDCQVDARKGISAITAAVQEIITNMAIDACYLITPFSPINYDNSQELNEKSIKELLHYVRQANSSGNEREIGFLPVSISDVNSYRRLAKCILLSMLAVSERCMDICPICGKALTENNGRLVCYSCNYIVMKPKCSHCGKLYTKCISTKAKVISIEKESLAYKMMYTEIEMNFNNTVDISITSNRDICPFCHEEQ